MTRFIFSLLTVFCYALAASAEGDDVDARFAAMQARIEELEQRLVAQSDELASAKQAPAAAPAASVTPDVAAAAEPSFFDTVDVSGYASTSFFYNFRRPDSDLTAGRSFDNQHADFMINKLKLALDKPLAAGGDKWDVGFRADLIFGQDAKLLQSAGLNLGDHGDLEQAFVTVNVPVGNGLQVSAGKWVTLMGVEVIEETVNPNWSEGNQFLFVENFTGTGIQLSYNWTDEISTQFRVYNGWDVVDDNNDEFSYMGRIAYIPDDLTSIALVGYGGPEQANNDSAWRSGVNLVASRVLTPKLTIWVQGDYGHEEANAALPIPTKDAEWWAAGLWVVYDVAEKMDVALRADFFDDGDGARTSSAPFTAPFPANSGQELTSLTLTLNLEPVQGLQIRPELRWDHSSAGLFEDDDGSFDEKDQFTLGVGAAYLF